MPVFNVSLLDALDRKHPFDAHGIEADSPEDALKLARGGALFLSPEDSLDMDLDDLRGSYDQQAALDGERGSEEVRVQEIWDETG